MMVVVVVVGAPLQQEESPWLDLVFGSSFSMWIYFSFFSLLFSLYPPSKLYGTFCFFWCLGLSLVRLIEVYERSTPIFGRGRRSNLSH
jgi:4-hydroxybenzoate polyprenyltransferase